MAQIFLNNCYATLAQAITATDTQIELSGMNGFPASVGVGDFFLLTLYADDSRYGSNIEVVKVTGLSGTTLTVERGYEEGTFAHVAGERAEARLTAATLDRIDQPNDWLSITDKPDTATRWPAFSEVTGKPNTYPPSSHTHSISNVNNLQNNLDSKRDINDTSFPRYDLNYYNATNQLFLSASNSFRVKVANYNRTLSFSNTPGTARSMCVVVNLYDITTGSVTWPSSINWSGGTAPELEGSWMNIVLFYVNGNWYGSVGAKG